MTGNLMMAESCAVAAQSMLPPAERSPEAYWQYKLAAGYRSDIEPVHNALWYRAAELLVQYGAPRIFMDGGGESGPDRSALSTGVLAVGKAQKNGDAQVVDAVRLSVATPGLSYAELPMEEIRRKANSGNVKKYDNAVKRLATFPSLTSIRFDALKVATKKHALCDEYITPTLLREAVPPRIYKNNMTAGVARGYFDERELAYTLCTKPEVTVWSDNADTHVQIERPKVPTLELSVNATPT